MSGLINCLHGHAAGQRGVADQGDYMMLFAFTIAGDGHTECSRNGSRGMASAERVIRRFVTAQKTAHAAVLLDGRKQITPAGENLVGISLVAHIPYQPVIRRIKCVMQRYRKFNRAE